MASTFKPRAFNITGGFDQSKQRHLTDPSTCWDLLNLRQVKGQLQQTPGIDSFVGLTVLNGQPADYVFLVRPYGGTVAHSSWKGLFVLDKYVSRVVNLDTPASQQYFPSIYQTFIPARTGLTGQCLMGGFNTTDFATDGDYFDVQIKAGGTTFQWRKNGGAWVTPVTIAASVALAGTGLTVYFQGQGATTDYTGFSSGDTWTWTRGANMRNVVAGAIGYIQPYSSDAFQTDLYFTHMGSIWRARNDFVTSVGYQPVLGDLVCIYQKHLFVGRFRVGVNSGGVLTDPAVLGTNYKNVLGWSHLDNPDQFFNTQINEADQFQCSEQAEFAPPSNTINDLATWRGLIYVFLADGITTGQYVGLPNVMQFTSLNGNVGALYPKCVVRTPSGLYFIGRNDFYIIKAYEPESIGERVRDKFFGEVSSFKWAAYDYAYNEIVWCYDVIVSGVVTQARIVAYSEITNSWYFRNIPNAYTDLGSTILCACSNPLGGGLLYGAYGLLCSDRPLTGFHGYFGDLVISNVAYDYTAPFFETPFLDYGDPWHIKQSSGLFIDADWSYPTNMANAKMNVYRSTGDLVGPGTAAMTAFSQSWNKTIATKRLSSPRDSYRRIAYKFEFKYINELLNGAKFSRFQEFFLGPELDVEK